MTAYRLAGAIPLMTWHQRSSLACLLCSRVAATVNDGVVTVSISLHAEFVRQLMCPYCGGRLIEQDAEWVRRLHPLPAEEDRPRRGRPPAPPAPPDVEAQRRRQRAYHERQRALISGGAR